MWGGDQYDMKFLLLPGQADGGDEGMSAPGVRGDE